MSAPGWYPDSTRPGQLRWWDGQRWTEHTAPAPPTTPQPGFGGAPAPGFGGAPAPGFGGAPAPGFGGAPAPGFGATPAPGFASPPAPVRQTTSLVLGIIGALLILFGLLTGAAGLLANAVDTPDDFVRTEGELVGVEQRTVSETFRTGTGDNRRTRTREVERFFGQYEYTVDGESFVIEGSKQRTRDDVDPTIEVAYDPDRPERGEVVTETEGIAVVLLIGAALIVLVGMVLIVVAVRSRRVSE